MIRPDSHSRDGGHCFEAGGVPDHLVQSIDNVPKARPAVSILLPTVQHELVQGCWTVHGGRQAVILLDGIDDL